MKKFTQELSMDQLRDLISRLNRQKSRKSHCLLIIAIIAALVGIAAFVIHKFVIKDKCCCNDCDCDDDFDDDFEDDDDDDTLYCSCDDCDDEEGCYAEGEDFEKKE